MKILDECLLRAFQVLFNTRQISMNLVKSGVWFARVPLDSEAQIGEGSDSEAQISEGLLY